MKYLISILIFICLKSYASDSVSECLDFIKQELSDLNSVDANLDVNIMNEDFWFVSQTQTVPKKMGMFALPRQSIASYGVSNSTVMVIITSRGRKYLAHITDGQNIIDLIPTLESEETATLWLFLGPRAITNSYLVNSADLQIQDIVQENSKIKIGLNSKFPYAMVQRNYGLDRSSFDVLFTAEGLIYFKFKSSKKDLK